MLFSDLNKHSNDTFEYLFNDYGSSIDNSKSPNDNIRHSNPFFEQVYAVVAQIPCGKVMSYGQIAKILGLPRGARTVGWAMRRCPEHLPWQRVVMADGTITGGVYAEIRKSLLEAENVVFLPDGRVDMAKCAVRF